MNYPDGTHSKYNAWTEDGQCRVIGYTFCEYNGEDFETLEECVDYIKSVFILESLECGSGAFDIEISEIVEYREDEKDYEHFMTIKKSEWLGIIYELHTKQKRLIEDMGNRIWELENE